MKSIILSVKPQEAVNILNGEQKIIIKKSAPKETPFKVYVYCTVSGATKNCHIDSKGRRNLLIDYCLDSILDERQTILPDLKGRRQLGKHSTHCFNYGTVLNGKVVSEFVCEGVIDFYLKPIHITDLKIYDEPKELEEFGVFCKDYAKCENIACYKDTCRHGFIPLKRPPATWMYVEGKDDGK